MDLSENLYGIISIHGISVEIVRGKDSSDLTRTEESHFSQVYLGKKEEVPNKLPISILNKINCELFLNFSEDF